MVQRKVPSKLGIQADHVKSDKSLANLKPSSSQHQDVKSRGTDRKKKMKKSRSIMLSNLEALQSPPSRRNLSQPGNPPPLHVATTAASPQKQKKPLVRTTDVSPNYMKPTSSSDAKKEIFPVSLRNTQSGSDGKKASCVSSKKPAKILTRSSSFNLVRTLTKTPSFKPSRACPRKSTTAVLCADVNAPERATCSSTLKDSKFPQYLMLNPGGTESEGASVMKVCSYTYCSLNCHRHAPLPPLKSFMSERRLLLKIQKSMKLEPLSPRRLKVPCETKKDYDIENNVFDGKPACDEADTGNPTITPLAQEIGMDFFIEIYAKEKEGADEMGKFDFVKDLDDQEDIKSAIEENGIAAGEDGVNVKQVTPTVPDAVPMSEIDLEEDFKNYFEDVAIEADTKESFHQEQNAEDADENHPPSWFHEDICMGSYSSEVSYDGEQMENIELDDSDSQVTDMEWEKEEQFCAFDHEEDNDSSVSVFTEEETDSKFESLSESSHDVSVMLLDDIFSSHYADILVEEAVQQANEEESTCFEAQLHGINSVLEGTSESIETRETHYLSNGTSCDQSSSTEEVFKHLTNAEENNRENEKHGDDEASCATMVLDEETDENSEGQKMSEACEVDDDESHKDSNSSLENSDESISQENQSTIVVQDQQLLEEDQVKANEFQSTSFICDEDENASKWPTRRKRPVQDDDEMRKINPRKPNLLPLVPDPEPGKVNLKHQMMDERKNAEEWMLDFALRQAVTKLAPAGKRKVALLVEAFETVMSIPKCETHLRNNSPFAHARPIQACS